jgi:hypothetical protein
MAATVSSINTFPMMCAMHFKPISKIPSEEMVVVPADCITVYAADPDNKEFATSVETINYGGKKVAAMIIFQGAYHLRKHFDNDIDGNILFARSPTGFSNDRLALVYLKHFDRYTKESTKGSYRMLIFEATILT